MADFDQEDTRLFQAKTATSRLSVGPHALVERNGIVFNDREALENYWVEDFTGFGRPEGSLSEEANPQEDGATPYPSTYGGRTMTMSGFIRAGSLPTAIEMKGALEDSLVSLIETPLVIGVQEGSPFLTPPEAQIYCRPSDWNIDSKVRQGDQSGLLLRDFTVALRATNPRYVSTSTKTLVITPTAVSALGRSYPRAYPLTYDTPMDPSGVPSSSTPQGIAHNAGNWPALPVVRFNGYMDGVRLVNEENGHMIMLTRAVEDGDYIEINMRTGRITNSLNERAASAWSSLSDWMRFEGVRGGSSGDNTLTLYVDDFGLGAHVDVSWEDTWMSA